MTPSSFVSCSVLVSLLVLMQVGAIEATAESPIQHQNDPADTILVLDSSGSMWGEIDGRHKILIARDVVGDLLEQLPENIGLGLMAYGHNRKSDCKDIELLAEVGASREVIQSAVNRLTPIGKTPLTESVKQAAAVLESKRRKATVVLVSDGEETCDADPCALGRELEASGVDFTAHVVGFGLSTDAQKNGLRCLATSTGGAFFEANDAADLATALEKTIAPEIAETSTIAIEDSQSSNRLLVRATDLAGGSIIETGLNWRVVSANDQKVLYESAKPEGSLQLNTLDQGRYGVSVERPADGAIASGNIFLSNGSSRTLTLALDVELRATLRADPAPTAAAGSELDVYWDGPNRKNDWIGLSLKGSAADEYLTYAYTKRGSPIVLKLPIDVGEYEVRYVLAKPTRVLASVPIATTGVTASIGSAKQGAAGAPLEVFWTGPNYNSDYIALVRPGDVGKNHVSYRYTKYGSPLLIDTPIDAGEFEILYVTGRGSKTLARRSVSTTAVHATLNLASSAKAGSQIPVTWAGPDYPNDWIGVAKKDAEVRENLSYTYTKRGMPLELQAPPDPGSYLVKYVSNRRVLATTSIDIEPVSADLAAPEKGNAGRSVEVSWTGPNYKSDYVCISNPQAPANRYLDYKYTRKGSTLKLDLPAEPGLYELRYVMAPGRTIIGRRPITVE